MNVWIGSLRVSLYDDYLKDVKRDTLIEEQKRYLAGLASEESITEAMSKLYDMLHPQKKQTKK